jgi:ethanolamine utilization protein EutN
LERGVTLAHAGAEAPVLRRGLEAPLYRQYGEPFLVERWLQPPLLAGGFSPRRTNRMQIAEVVGTVVSTQKNRKLEGAKLLLVQPLSLEGTPRGTALLAIDSVGAGVGEKVLVVIEGKAAGDALGRKAAAVDAAVIGIVDAVDYQDTP